jgi:uncharacterized protein
VSERFAIWNVVETAGYESAWLTLDGLALRAVGQAAGQFPEPYWLSYTLDTDAAGATSGLQVAITVRGATRELRLARRNHEWSVDGQVRPDLRAALDCDLACSPVTNTMPILRHGLHHGPGSEQFTMAFVELPSLQVVAVPQQYRHLESVEGGGARVRYSSGTFTSDIHVDSDGLVIDYPTMARRVPAQTPGSMRPDS